jgi:hypothetical protein
MKDAPRQALICHSSVQQLAERRLEFALAVHMSAAEQHMRQKKNGGLNAVNHQDDCVALQVEH